ncbi:hypothetical protein AUP68_09376 [Ilyonectria robusta]
MAAKSGFSLHVTIFIDPLNVAEFFKHFKLAYENVIVEPECTFFEVYQSPENPGELRWVENCNVTSFDTTLRPVLAIALNYTANLPQPSHNNNSVGDAGVVRRKLSVKLLIL